MPLVAAAAIPTLLTEDDVAVLDRLPPHRQAVVLASGHELLLHDAPTASTSAPGAPSRHVRLTIDETLLRAIARRTQAPRTHTSQLTESLGALAAVTAATGRAPAVVPITIGARAQAWALAATAVGIARAVQATGQDTVVIASGDLADSAAGGDGLARRWDELAASAFDDGDTDGFAALGPTSAAEVGAVSWAPLMVLLTLIRQVGLRTGRRTYRLDGNLGRLTALALPAAPETRRAAPPVPPPSPGHDGAAGIPS